jgi:hypothetical protein
MWYRGARTKIWHRFQRQNGLGAISLRAALRYISLRRKLPCRWCYGLRFNLARCITAGENRPSYIPSSSSGIPRLLLLRRLSSMPTCGATSVTDDTRRPDEQQLLRQCGRNYSLKTETTGAICSNGSTEAVRGIAGCGRAGRAAMSRRVYSWRGELKIASGGAHSMIFPPLRIATRWHSAATDNRSCEI